jgi:nucleoside-diphosphate-sugar epimerase
MSKVLLLTGATGLIGRHTIAPLLASNYQIHAVTSRPMAYLPEHTALTWHLADLLDPSQIGPLLGNVRPTHLLHLAWSVETGKFWSSATNLAWVEASLRLLRTFVSHGGTRVVGAGTCAEYAWNLSECCTPQTPLQPATLYGTAKLALWHMVEQFAETHPFSAAWGRIFSPYGPNEQPQRLVAATIRALLRGQEARCSHGRQVRDFLYAADVADAFVALLDSPVTGALDIASGEGLRVADLVTEIAVQIGRPDLVHLGALAAPALDPPRLVGDTTRLTCEVGWKPQFTRADALAQTITWWRHHL